MDGGSYASSSMVLLADVCMAEPSRVSKDLPNDEGQLFTFVLLAKILPGHDLCTAFAWPRFVLVVGPGFQTFARTDDFQRPVIPTTILDSELIHYLGRVQSTGSRIPFWQGGGGMNEADRGGCKEVSA
ncbi:hypothetical protein N7494_001515 [Penicillium frequentans]|uniref:Uncharacterized protein n=1 Tax=Penicillium frequentans TaxID=3151616 RepID=A0AAD6D1W5_9EURO|nr:hypothetical protein N7494_001515 [Penicillium glabrum]